MAKALSHLNLTAYVASRPNHSRSSLPCRPMMVATSTPYKKSYWTSIHEDIEAHLKRAVVVKEPVEVFEPMRHLVFAAPVNTAPPLCIAACELVGGHRDQAMAAAAALHVMHAASFAREHLPLSDRPSLIPKPKPMFYHAFNPNVELLTGDGMVPFGLELLANSNDPVQDNSGRILQAIAEITRAMGSQGVIEGQYIQLLQLQHNQSNDKGLNSKETVNRTCEKKEGGLHACAAACGAILGGGSEEEVEKLRRYGFYVGMVQAKISQRLGSKEEEEEEEVEELQNLALKEVEGFDEAKVEAISTFLRF